MRVMITAAAVAALFTTSNTYAQERVPTLGDFQVDEPTQAQQARPVASTTVPSQHYCSARAGASGGMTFTGSCSAEIAAYNAAKRQQSQRVATTAQQWVGKNCNLVAIDGGFRWLNKSCSRDEAVAQWQETNGGGGVVRTRHEIAANDTDARFERRVEFLRQQENKARNAELARAVVGSVAVAATNRLMYGRNYGYGYNNYARANCPTVNTPYGTRCW